MKKEIPLFKVSMSSGIDAPLLKVLHSGYIGEGEQVKKFETNLLHYFDNTDIRYSVITCNSATSAEHMTYHMLKAPRKLTTFYEYASSNICWSGLDSKSEVISTPLTCTATNWPILHNGLKLVWADIDPTTMNISLDSIAEKITENTRIIQVVHWGGYPVDMDRLNSIVFNAEMRFGHRILIIEDCAHAMGSLYKETNVGFTGNLSTFSFQAIKHLTTVDGGALCSPYEEFSQAARLIRWYGIDRNSPRTDFRCEQDIPEIGFKFHMNDVNATIGIENLQHLPSIINRHKKNGLYYNQNLKNISGITLLACEPGFDSSYWLYTIRVKDRLNFMKKMSECGIVTSRVHERNDKHPPLVHLKTHLPNLDEVTNDMVCIPVGWWVTDEDREYIINCIKQGW